MGTITETAITENYRNKQLQKMTETFNRSLVHNSL